MHPAFPTAFDFFGAVHLVELLHGMVHAHHRTSLPAKPPFRLV